jgi:hypothetical protein
MPPADRILGYSALVVHHIDTRHFPSERSLPKRLPCVLLGRLAVDRRRRGENLATDAYPRRWLLLEGPISPPP